MAKRDILGVGTAAVDDLLTVERYPEADEKAAVLESRRRFGGLVATALAAAARLGATCTYAGLLTDDDLGRAVRTGLETHGVDCGPAAHHPDGCTIHSRIVVERTRPTRTIFFSAPRDYPPGLPDVRSALADHRVLVVDQLGLAAARMARVAGVPVVADLEWPDRDDLEEYLAVVDHLILSATAATAITGEKDPARAVAALAPRGAPRACTAVTLGAGGSVYRERDGEPRTLPAPRVRVVETNGCGDVFHGAYAAALSRGVGVEGSLRAATAAAALFAERPGGWEHLPTAAEVAAATSLMRREGGGTF